MPDGGNNTGSPQADLRPSGFFVLRTPLLPLSTFLDWGAAATAPSPSEGSGALRAGLAAIVGRPEVREAIYVASPDLHSAADSAEAGGGKAERAERAMVRYVARMSSRATPFGLFAGCSVGVLGAQTEVCLPPLAGYRRHTRLDMEYVASLVVALEADPGLRDLLTYRPNSSIYRGGGRVRYVEALLKDRVRQHRLVAVDDSDYLAATLDRAALGARLSDLAAPLVDAEITLEDATAFIHELIDGQVLVADLEPPVTGRAPLLGLASAMETLATPERPWPGEVARILALVHAQVEEMDSRPPGGGVEVYGEVARILGSLPPKVELPRLFQVDMTKPSASATIGPAVVRELQRAIQLLHAFAVPIGQESLKTFADRFTERYEGREVPLQEVLDEELGIGFEASAAPSAEASPLLRDLHFPGRPGYETRWTPAHAFMLRRLHECLQRGDRRMEISLDEARQVGTANPQPLPDALAISAAVAAPSAEAVEQGDFRVVVQAAVGPSGARMLGRFCHTDPTLERWVNTHLRAEEAAHPDALFAEVVHLPEGRIGNIVMRPVLRRHEIPYLGRSAAPIEDQVPVSDLLVSVAGGRVCLRSARLGREVIPRLSTAHNYGLRSIGMYRFLCSLQNQGVAGALTWDWGPLAGAHFLPRVTSGRLILFRARWLLDQSDIAPLKEAGEADSHDAVQALRDRLGLPRLVLLTDADNELLTDLDNPLSVDTLVHLLRQRREATLTEMVPGPDELWVEGPEGRFASELIVPFERPAPPASNEVGQHRASAQHAPLESYLPGSEWLYLKAYCGTSTADILLRDVLAPVLRQARDQGHVDRWFFIRYGDPDWHIRLRLHGLPEVLVARILPAFHAALAPALTAGLLRRVVVDTYDPESERYGGPVAMPIVERIFEADSEAVLSIVELLSGDDGMDARWRLAVVGCDGLLDDLGLDLGARRGIMRDMRDAYRAEFSADHELKKRVGERYRRDGSRLEQLLRNEGEDAERLAPGIELLRARSAALREPVAALRAVDSRGELSRPLGDIAASLLHMHVNRLLRSAHRAQELVIYDLLDRLYMSRSARA